MSARKVKLYIRIRTPEGRDVFAAPVWNRNRTLRGGYAQGAGKQAHQPEGVYYLRYLRAGKRSWHAVGTSSEAAVAAQRNAEHDLDAMALGRTISRLADLSDSPGTITANRSIQAAVDEYVEEVRRFREAKLVPLFGDERESNRQRVEVLPIGLTRNAFHGTFQSGKSDCRLDPLENYQRPLSSTKVTPRVTAPVWPRCAAACVHRSRSTASNPPNGFPSVDACRCRLPS